MDLSNKSALLMLPKKTKGNAVLDSFHNLGDVSRVVVVTRQIPSVTMLNRLMHSEAFKRSVDSSFAIRFLQLCTIIDD